jgi:Fe-S-cluster containining protein
MEASARRAGPLFACGPGRRDCCIGPFPVNLTDVRRLQRGLVELARRDPARARAVRRRTLRACARLIPGYPGDAQTGLLSGDEDAEERFCGAHADEPCPALDPRSHRCDLYPWRPLVCRTMGPPVRIGDTDLPPCPYCFAQAPASEIERCRATPDPAGREDRLLRRLETRSGLSGETLIAFALLGRPRLL